MRELLAPTPHYSQDGATLYLGDARALLPQIETDPENTVVITDPVWPNAPMGMFPGVDPLDLFAEVAQHFPAKARRVVVILGCSSDPRFLSAMPSSMPFVRTCWLRYHKPSRRGTILIGGDVAYVFGDHRAVRPRRVLPGEVSSVGSLGRGPGGHPCPRSIAHLHWLVDHFTRPTDTVLDPFAGSGTTLRAAVDAGRRAVGIEIHEPYTDEAVRKLRQRSMFTPRHHAVSTQLGLSEDAC